MAGEATTRVGAPASGLAIRPAGPGDAQRCGLICYKAFAAIAKHHGFPPDFRSVEEATGVVSALIDHPAFYGVVAEREGTVVGSNFLDERSPVHGVGPVSVDPEAQDRRIGRALMEAVLARSAERGAVGVRLLQVAYHNRSLSLYAKLGFDVREPFAAMQGEPLRLTVGGYAVRPAEQHDEAACNALCRRVHGHDRAGELRDAVGQGVARVVERQGRITGYATGIGFFSHAVAETNEDLQALIGAAERFAGPGFLVPLRNGELMRFCLAHGLRVFYVMNLMTVGLYQEPRGPFLASVLY